jgi:hypothetical protein
MKSKVNKTPQTVKDAAWDKVLARHGNPAPPAAPKAAPKAPTAAAARRTTLSAEASHRNKVDAIHAESMKAYETKETAERRKRETELAKHAGARARFAGDLKGVQKLSNAYAVKADAEADAAEAKAAVHGDQSGQNVGTHTPRKSNSILAQYAAMDHGEKRREFWDKNKRAILAAVDNNNAN